MQSLLLIGVTVIDNIFSKKEQQPKSEDSADQ